MSGFRHQPLETPQTIRLLLIHPGHGDERISCSLRHVSLYENPVYDGLSYTWGNLSLTQMLICNGIETQVTSNLYDALRRYRSEEEEVVLWADQLCINQSDTQERSQQVCIMRYIYRFSERCLAYLGQASDDDALATEFIDDLGKGWEYDQQKGVYHAKDPASISTWKKDIRWSHLFKLFSRPWFSRVWILQEAVLAPECLMSVGTYNFNLVHLQRALYVIHQLNFGEPPATYVGGRSEWSRTLICLANLTKLSKSSVGGRETRIAHILHNSRTALATDPRDKVYALLGLTDNMNPEIVPDDPLGISERYISPSRDAVRNGIVPDYSLSVQVVYVNTARVIVRSGGGLQLLNIAASNGRTTLEGLPSWVPDWSCSTAEPDGWIDTNQATLQKLYRAGLSRPANVKLYQSPDSLASILGIVLDNEADRISASGGLIDIIADVAAIFYLTETNDDFLRIEQMLGWWKSAQEIVQDWVSYPTAESSFTALWRTLMANQTIGNVRPSPDYVHRAKAFLLSRLLVDLVRGLDNEAPPMWDTYELGLREKGVPMLELTQRTRPEPMHVPLAAIHYQQAFWSTCHDRRFCVTKKGYFGIVPQQAKVGDVISIFAGAELPFVLRSREDAQSYEVIGRCYIHGVSDGEVWEWNDFKSEDIIIS